MNTMSTKVVFTLLYFLSGTDYFVNLGTCFNMYPKIKQIQVTGDPGEPLILTPLIEEGKLKEARSSALVGRLPGVKNIKSYSGYLTVNKAYNSNLFFWFFPSKVNYESAPVVLWLQGGPGASSLFGLFAENGPFSVGPHHYLKERKYSWTTTHSVIYIDNPVGTGYSFTTNGYAQNETAVGQDLYNALVQFFKLFPEIQHNDFFATGESYAGKYVPAVCYRIHTENPKAALKINLKGMAIGNGYSDPVNMLRYGDYLYQLGLIDSIAREEFHTMENKTVQYITENKWSEATDVFSNILDGLFFNLTGFRNYYNYLNSNPKSSNDTYDTFVQQTKVRRAIHVGNSTFHSGEEVENFLKQDFMKSVKPWIEALLEQYRVLIYNGQLDIIVAYPLTENYLKTLQWSAAAEYKNATRFKWKVRDELAGFVKTAGNLTEILVRNAGHMVPSDQPLWALDLLSRFTANKPFHNSY